MHLIIDGYGSTPELLKDEQFIYHFLDTYPGKIGMTKISPPYVTHYTQGKPEDWGISGFVFIAESHISIHTFEQRGAVNIDIFSCKDFDDEKIIQELHQALHLTRLRVHLIDRNLEALAVPEEKAAATKA
ncbi:S-adenosylmethionine decarboxylase [Chloroflexota bacterium]